MSLLSLVELPLENPLWNTHLDFEQTTINRCNRSLGRHLCLPNPYESKNCLGELSTSPAYQIPMFLRHYPFPVLDYQKRCPGTFADRFWTSFRVAGNAVDFDLVGFPRSSAVPAKISPTPPKRSHHHSHVSYGCRGFRRRWRRC